MFPKLKKSLILSSLLAVVISLGAVGVASAESLHADFACNDNTTAIKIAAPDANHNVIVTCASGSQITYLAIPAGSKPVAVDASCPNAEKVGLYVDVAAQIRFGCVNLVGRDDPVSTPSGHNPTVKAGTASAAAVADAACTGDCTGKPILDKALNGGGKCSSVSNCDLIKDYIQPFINLLIALVGLVVVIAIVVGGIQYGSSAGDPQKTAAAKVRIRNAIIALGAFILLFAGLNFLIPGGLI